jgi:hypothetical protein
VEKQLVVEHHHIGFAGVVVEKKRMPMDERMNHQ